MKLNNCQICGIQLAPDDFDGICCECEENLFCQICGTELTPSDKEDYGSYCIDCILEQSENAW